MTFAISGQFVVIFKWKKLHADTSALRALRAKYTLMRGFESCNKIYFTSNNGDNK